jgi:hypothetical protein
MESSTFTPYISPRLRIHLSQLPSSIRLDFLSRIPTSRLSTTALPNISLIELVSAQDFAKHYDNLYVEMFPKRAERENSDLIVARLEAEERGEREGLAPYRIVGIRNRTGGIVGAAQFSVLPVPSRKRRRAGKGEEGTPNGSMNDGVLEEKGGPRFAVPYLQYIYVHPDHRRQDMSEVLHTMVLAVAVADAAVMDEQDSVTPTPTMSMNSQASSKEQTKIGRTVPFTLFETEPPDHGDDYNSRAYALERSKIHTKSGGVALVLRRERPTHQISLSSSSESAVVTSSKSLHNGTVEEHQEEEIEILSAHVQPGLEPSDPPLTLAWMIRPSPLFPAENFQNLQSLGRGLVTAYYQSLRDEGFPERNIKLAERIVARRMEGSVFETMPLANVKDFTMEGYLDIDTEHG